MAGVCAARRLSLPSLLITAVLLGGCHIDWVHAFGSHSDDDGKDNTATVDETDISGLDVAVSDSDFDTTYSQLRNAIAGQTARIQQIDLQQLAETAGRDIRPTRVILFDNPARTTPILAADARAGLDLPPAMLVYQDDDGGVGVAYDAGDYFRARFDVGDADDAVDALDDNLATLAGDAAGNGVSRHGETDTVGRASGVIERDSDDDFSTTLDRLTDAIDARNDTTLVARIDHREAASSAGLDLDPSVLVLFDAGEDDARLIGGGQTVGIDLPQRLLVTQDDDGDVHLYYNDPAYLASRHRITARDDTVDDLSELLGDLADAAAGR